MANEQGKKRLLSPGNINPETNPDDKRRRNDSVDIDDFEPSQLEDMAQAELSLSDINKKMDIIMQQLTLSVKVDDLKNLANKNDLKIFDDRLLAQSQEIGQLREEMKSLKGDFDVLQSNLDSHIAASFDAGGRSVGHDLRRDPGRRNFNMVSFDVNNTRAVSTPRRNLVIEGLGGDSDMEITAEFIRLTAAIGVTVYAKEVEQVIRMSRRDENNKKPGPVLLTLTRIVLRDTILKKKGGLIRVTGGDKVFINADESPEVRKAKSFLRKAAYHAKRMGENVLFKHNCVSINGVAYNTEDYDQIPAKYLGKSSVDNQEEREEAMEAAGGEPQPVAKEGLIRKGERMRITRKGLCFSGPSCYISNMAYIPIKFNNRDYDSNEQGYQWTKAMDHHDPDLAKEIKKTDNSYEVKTAGGLVTSSPEWKRCAPDLIERMFELKLDQHPEVLERLIDTYPLDLIEASTDSTWGGGAPFSSEIYDKEDPLPGDNLFGEIATRVRNRRIENMKRT